MSVWAHFHNHQLFQTKKDSFQNRMLLGPPMFSKYMHVPKGSFSVMQVASKILAKYWLNFGGI